MRHCVAVLVPIIAGLAGLLQVRAQTINTLAGGGGTPGYSGDNGQAAEARINFARGVAVDRQGNVFIADTENHRIRKVTNNVITTVAGTGTEGTSADTGLLATAARLSFPRAVAVDQAGNLYIADTGNSKIHKVGTDGRISKIAGMTTAGFSGDGGSATLAQLNNPRSLVVDSAGNIYVADGWNFRIRKITAAGIIQTVAGNGSYGAFGDGGLATQASLGLIGALALDSKGSLYLADIYNHRIRVINSSGAISTYAGGQFGPAAEGGTAQSATLRFPRGLAMDAQENLLLSDSLNHQVRKVTTAGIMGTVAGTGVAGFSGDGAAASKALLNHPAGLCVDSIGTVFVADMWNSRIRSVQGGAAGACGCDANSDGQVNVADVQVFINRVLGVGTAGCDVNGDGSINVADVQMVINAVLGLDCK